MKIHLIVFLMVELPSAFTGTTKEWKVGVPNICNNPNDVFIDFEEGQDRVEVKNTFPGVRFSNTGGLNWLYADIRTGTYNAGNANSGLDERQYQINGNFFAWLGERGDRGRIDFAGASASYFSALVSVGPSGLNLEAYDESGGVLDTVHVTDNLYTGENNRTTTRATLEAEGISYIEVFDRGNFWLIDDICTDAASPCRFLPSRAHGPQQTRFDVVFLRDEDYKGTAAEYEAIVNEQIDERLLSYAPLDDKDKFFNFYISDTLMGDSVEKGDTCGPKILPPDFYDLCPFADAVAVLHTEEYSDCCCARVFSSEADIKRSFIHEAGHGIFGLSDEYDDSNKTPPCETGRPTVSDNTFVNEEECEAAALANGRDAGDCFEFTTCGGGMWKIDDKVDQIMDDGENYENGWSPSSVWYLTDLFEDLAAGRSIPGGGVGAESQMKSLYIKVTFDKDGITLNDSGFIISPSPQYLFGDADSQITIFNDMGEQLGVFPFKDPRPVLADPDYSGPSYYESIDMNFIVPYFADVASGTITNGNESLEIDLSTYSGLPLDVSADAGGPYEVEEASSVLLDASGSMGDIVLFEWDINSDGIADFTSIEPTYLYTPLDDYDDAILLTVISSSGRLVQAQSTLKVSNSPPMVEAGSDMKGFVSQPLSLTDASFTDKGIEDTHTAVWSWGDGTDDVTIAVDSTTKSVAASHIYDAVGTFVASLTVTDNDGGVSTDSTQISIAAPVPKSITAPPSSSDERTNEQSFEEGQETKANQDAYQEGQSFQSLKKQAGKQEKDEQEFQNKNIQEFFQGKVVQGKEQQPQVARNG